MLAIALARGRASVARTFCSNSIVRSEWLQQLAYVPLCMCFFSERRSLLMVRVHCWDEYKNVRVVFFTEPLLESIVLCCCCAAVGWCCFVLRCVWYFYVCSRSFHVDIFIARLMPYIAVIFTWTYLCPGRTSAPDVLMPRLMPRQCWR